MAAITTIKQGFQRFLVLGFGTQNNTVVSSTGPTYANTTGSFNTYGNRTYGTATTTFGGQQTVVSGSNDAQMQVVMLNPGDMGYEDALDARQVLGPDWSEKVEKGINNCF
jgi:hypothetical protein